MVDLGENNIDQEAEVPEGENDGGVRLAEALCLASCAAFLGWSHQIVKVAVVASLSVALAAEAIRIFGKKGVNAGDSKPRVFQGQYDNGSSGEESLVATKPPCERDLQRNKQNKKGQSKKKRRKYKKRTRGQN